MAERAPIDESNFVRSYLHSNESAFVRYRRLVCGEESLTYFAYYELVTFFLGWIPGALGLALRRVFYRPLFFEAGRGLTIGHHVTLRNARNMRIGNNVTFDDNGYVDARGSGRGEFRIGNQVILGRGAMLHAKSGDVTIGANTVVGANSMLVSQNGLSVGEWVAIAGGVKISGGLFEMKPIDDNTTPPYIRVSTGPIHVEDECVIGTGAVIVDGVRVGRRSMIGPNSLIVKSVPESTISTARPAMAIPNKHIAS